MMVRLLSGPKAGKIADVTNETGRALIAAGEAESAEHLPSPEILPQKPESEKEIVFVPVVMEPEAETEEEKPRKRRRN